MKTLFGVLAVGVVVGALGAVVLSSGDADAAPQTKQIAYDDAKIVNDHGGYQRLPDAGYEVECCGLVHNTATGKPIPVDSPCVRASAGALTASFNACLTEWRTINAY